MSLIRELMGVELEEEMYFVRVEFGWEGKVLIVDSIFSGFVRSWVW